MPICAGESLVCPSPTLYLLYFKVTPLRYNLSIILLWPALNLMVPQRVQITIHTSETGMDNQHWKQFSTATPSAGMLLPLAIDQGKCWLHTDLCTSFHLRTRSCLVPQGAHRVPSFQPVTTSVSNRPPSHPTSAQTRHEMWSSSDRWRADIEPYVSAGPASLDHEVLLGKPF